MKPGADGPGPTDAPVDFDSGRPVIVFLVGMMGSGKSTVGQRLATAAGARFVDLDAEVERHSGQAPAALFAGGEAAFRRAEREALVALLGREKTGSGRLVVATGGGTLLDPANAASVLARGAAVYLDVPPDELAERLRHSDRGARPLLAGGDVRELLGEFMVARAAVYASCQYRVDGNAAVEEVARRVRDIVGWNSALVRVRVPAPARDYDVLVGSGLLDQLGAQTVARVPSAREVMVVTDKNVARGHLAPARASLGKCGLKVHEHVLPPGEGTKSVAALERLVDAMLGAGLSRSDVVVGLGGGVVGDLAGLAAALCMRGLALIQAPTSLLAQVDSSVGGKVAVNRPAGKNLFGAFHFPRLVLIDPRALATLPRRERASGIAEMLKHGALFDPDHFDRIVAQAPRLLGDTGDPAALIARSVALKARCVAADPRERAHGGRELLNLGHTVGHALEHGSRGELTHGEAVGLGLIAAARISARVGLAPIGLEDQMTRALNACSLPTDLDAWLEQIGADAVLAAVRVDKKRQGHTIRFVALAGLGNPSVVLLSGAEIGRLLRRENRRC